jgi:hypothetical protein
MRTCEHAAAHVCTDDVDVAEDCGRRRVWREFVRAALLRQNKFFVLVKQVN